MALKLAFYFCHYRDGKAQRFLIDKNQVYRLYLYRKTIYKSVTYVRIIIAILDRMKVINMHKENGLLNAFNHGLK